MQQVSASKWPEAARFKTKNHIGLHSVYFRVCSTNFHDCSGNFRVCFWRHCVQKNGMPQFTHRHGCKTMPQIAQGLQPPTQFQVSASHNAPIQSNTWICAAIYHGVVTVVTFAEMLVQMIFSHQSFLLPCFMTAQTAKQASNALCNSKYQDFEQTSLFQKMCQKRVSLKKKLFSK